MKNQTAFTRNSARRLFLTAAGIASVFGLILVGALNAPLSHAQSEKAVRPQFEVASIKANKSADDSTRISPPVGGRLVARNITLKALTTVAYQIQDFQISGQPGWFDSDRYDIEAKADGNSTTAEMQAMLQALLFDRFKLMFHRDSKEFPAFALVVTKNGPKMKHADPAKCVPNPTGSCGVFRASPIQIIGERVSMTQFAARLSRALGRTVVDKTDLEGVFDLNLEWEPNQPVVSPDGATPNGGPQTVSPASGTIFTAVQEQLGLKLESDKIPMEIFVIDHVERPSEN